MDAVNVGDAAHWDFVFGWADSSGVVVAVDGDRYLVEQSDWGVVEQHWMNRDEFVSDNELATGEF
jgi:hypothetical protein